MGEALDRLLIAQYITWARQLGEESPFDRRENVGASVKAVTELAVLSSRIASLEYKTAVTTFRHKLYEAMLMVGKIPTAELQEIENSRAAANDRIAEELRAF